MHDRHNHDRMNPDNHLADALRALPSQSPPHDRWPLLAARVRRRRRVRHGLWLALPGAVAAAIILALAVPVHPTATTRPTSPAKREIALAQRSDTMDTQVAQLRSHSRRLQALVQQLRGDSPLLDGHALAIAAGIQDQIGLVDLQLGAAQTAQAQTPLWRRRITLLQGLAVLHLGANHGYERLGGRAGPTPQNANWTD